MVFLIITYYHFYVIDTDYVHTKLRNVETFVWVFHSGIKKYVDIETIFGLFQEFRILIQHPLLSSP